MTKQITATQARSTWCCLRFGFDVEIHRRVIDDASILFGVMEFQPVDADGIHRKHWTYVTNGMSERRMPWTEGPTVPDRLKRYRIELITYASSRSEWVVELLTEMARYPFEHATGFFHGHTIPVITKGPRLWDGYVLTIPTLEHETLNPLGLEVDALAGDPVIWLQVVGLKANELSFAIDSGGQELLDRYLKPSEDPNRLLLDCKRESIMG